MIDDRLTATMPWPAIAAIAWSSRSGRPEGMLAGGPGDAPQKPARTGLEASVRPKGASGNNRSDRLPLGVVSTKLYQFSDSIVSEPAPNPAGTGCAAWLALIQISPIRGCIGVEASADRSAPPW
jgi:hypothetical protein